MLKLASIPFGKCMSGFLFSAMTSWLVCTVNFWRSWMRFVWNLLNVKARRGLTKLLERLTKTCNARKLVDMQATRVDLVFHMRMVLICCLFLKCAKMCRMWML